MALLALHIIVLRCCIVAVGSSVPRQTVELRSGLVATGPKKYGPKFSLSYETINLSTKGFQHIDLALIITVAGSQLFLFGKQLEKYFFLINPQQNQVTKFSRWKFAHAVSKIAFGLLCLPSL